MTSGNSSLQYVRTFTDKANNLNIIRIFEVKNKLEIPNMIYLLNVAFLVHMCFSNF